jgi:hypothetical protein
MEPIQYSEVPGAYLQYNVLHINQIILKVAILYLQSIKYIKWKLWL